MRAVTPNKLAVSVAEAASLVSVATRTMRAWIASGRVRAVHLGRRVVVPVAELERLLALDSASTHPPAASAPSVHEP